MSTKWIAWQHVAHSIQVDDGIRVIQSIEQFVDAAVNAESVGDLLRVQLPELAGELAANSVGIFVRKPEWVALAQHGRIGLNEMPKNLLMEVLDRDAGVVGPLDSVPGAFLAATPLRSRSQPGAVLVFAGRSFPDDVLPSAMLMSKGVGACVDFLERRSQSVRRIDQLQSILKISLNLSAVHETEPLLELIAREATRLLDCDRASIFIWDKEHREVVACPALGVDGNSLRLGK